MARSQGPVGPGSDSTAIHDDTAGEIAAVAQKTAVVPADLILIEDSADSNNKKRATVGDVVAGALGAVFKSYPFSTQGIGSGTYFTAGFYDFSTTDANLTQASTTATHGAANVAYAAHASLIAGGAGSASGGSGAVEIECSGTSITDAGVRTAADTEVIVSDITAMSANAYYETVKKWLGTVTYTIKNASGSTQTTFSADFNYGLSKYEDFGNIDFTVTDFEMVGLGGAADTAFNVTLYHHHDQNWTYAATGFVPGGTVICDMNTDHSTEQNLGNGEFFAYKRDNLSTVVDGSALEGVIVQVDVGQNNSVRFSTVHIGVNPG